VAVEVAEVASRRRRWALGVLSLAVVVIGMDNFILNLALPTLVRELAATASQLQWMVDAYVVVFAGLLLSMGALGDRFGRKRLLNLGLLVFVVQLWSVAVGGVLWRRAGVDLAATAPPRHGA
jgi:MFS family permease